MAENKFIQIRFNMRNPLHKKVWENIINYDKSEYKSYSDVVIKASSYFFERMNILKDDPFLETKENENEFINRITEGVKNTLQQVLPQFMLSCLIENSLHSSVDFNANSEANVDMDDIDWDFVGKG